MAKPLKREESLFPSAPAPWEKRENENGDRSGTPERLSDAAAAVPVLAGGEAAAGASPSNTHLLSSQEADQRYRHLDWERAAFEQILLTEDCYSGPIECPDLCPGAVLAIDWLEEGALVEWTGFNSDREQLMEKRDEARAQGFHSVLHDLAGQPVAVNPRGWGNRNTQALNYRFDFAHSIVAFSNESSNDRRHSNLFFRIPGEACLLYGAPLVRRHIRWLVEQMSGIITDSWVRRIDFCLDLPDVDLKDWLLSAFEEERFLTTSRTWNPWKGKEGCSGFTVGNKRRVCLIVYDKLREFKKQSEIYQRAMIENRWGGRVPKSATRIEYQISKNYLDGFGLNRSGAVFNNRAAILERLTEVEKRPFFAMTNEQVDRKNKHQGRTTRHPEWARVAATIRHLVGTPIVPLERPKRGKLSHKKACSMILGAAIGAAANEGRLLETVPDLLDLMELILERNGVTDEQIAQIWNKKALAAGTLTEPESFDFGYNIADELLSA